MRWWKPLAVLATVLFLAGCLEGRPSGTYLVGDGAGQVIPAGTYRTRVATPSCYWERLRGFSGEFSDIIANEFTGDVTIVTINPTDAGFRVDGCAPLSSNLSPLKIATTDTGPGQWIVGDYQDVAPGLWQSAGGNACYWERQRGFSGEFSDIITNSFTTGGTVNVQISASDAGFKQSGCWPFVKIG